MAESTILLVEDNAVNRMVALGMLGLLGRAADVATDGLEALQALHARPYNIVLMDIQMPELDGLAATARVRDEFAAAEQPYIIALTANAMPGDEQRFLRAGMDAYLAKPITKAQLEGVLRQAEADRDGLEATRKKATP